MGKIMIKMNDQEVGAVSGAAWADNACLDGYMGGMIGGAIAGSAGGFGGALLGGFGGLIGGAIAGGCFRGNSMSPASIQNYTK